jgi:hypothetical protein
MLYHRSCYKTYTSRRNCGFFNVESAGSDHKADTSQVPLLNEQTDDTSTDIALCIFCGKQTFKKDRKLYKIKTAERLQNVKDVTEWQNDYKMSGLLSNATFIDKAVYHSGCITQALVSFKKYMPPPLPYFKVNICPFPLPHFASICFAYVWPFQWSNYIVTLPRYFSFRLPHLNIPTGPPSDELDKNIQRTSHGLLLSHWNRYSHFRFALHFSYAFGIL